jgi:hypothetical protein
MRTNKEKLKAIIERHLYSMNADIVEQMSEQIGNDNWYMDKFIEGQEKVLINTYNSAIDWVSEGEYIGKEVIK